MTALKEWTVMPTASASSLALACSSPVIASSNTIKFFNLKHFYSSSGNFASSTLSLVYAATKSIEMAIEVSSV